MITNNDNDYKRRGKNKRKRKVVGGIAGRRDNKEEGSS